MDASIQNLIAAYNACAIAIKDQSISNEKRAKLLTCIKNIGYTIKIMCNAVGLSYTINDDTWTISAVQ